MNQLMYLEIFRRRSVRKYEPQMPEEELGAVKAQLKKAIALDRGERVVIRLVEAGQVSPAMGVSPPWYLLAYGADSAGGRREAGFRLEQLSLWMSARGIGSCFLGMARPKKEARSLEEPEVLMALGFGMPAMPLHREPAGFSRKQPAEVGTLEPGLLEPVRLAPSAVNAQPWFFAGEGEGAAVYQLPPSGLKALLAGKMAQLDIGIALCHLALAVGEMGRELAFTPGGDPVAQGPVKGIFVGNAVWGE